MKIQYKGHSVWLKRNKVGIPKLLAKLKEIQYF